MYCYVWTYVYMCKLFVCTNVWICECEYVWVSKCMQLVLQMYPANLESCSFNNDVVMEFKTYIVHCVHCLCVHECIWIQLFSHTIFFVYVCYRNVIINITPKVCSMRLKVIRIERKLMKQACLIFVVLWEVCWITSIYLHTVECGLEIRTKGVVQVEALKS